MSEQSEAEILVNNLKNYVNTNCELMKLSAIEHTTVIGSSLVSWLLIAMIGFLVTLFVSLGLGFYISNKFDNNYSGFVFVAGFYFIVGFVLILGRKTLIEMPFGNKIIKRMLGTKVSCENGK